MTFGTANPGKTSPKPPAIEKRLHRPHHHRAQRSRARLEAFLVCPHILVKVSLEQLIEAGAFGMPWPVWSRRFREGAAAGILGHNAAPLGGARTGEDRQAVTGHGGLRPPRGRLRAAIEI
jgi:hypothetical protein